jgi:nucleoside diphosphate kinase
MNIIEEITAKLVERGILLKEVARLKMETEAVKRHFDKHQNRVAEIFYRPEDRELTVMDGWDRSDFSYNPETFELGDLIE